MLPFMLPFMPFMPPIPIERLGPGDEAVLASLALEDADFDLDDRSGPGRPLSAEAARRAGISVPAIRVSVFMIGSTLAALSGIIEASRLNSVTPGSGAGNQLLLGVGAAVIGGTSLFGGKGKVSNAVIGGLVVATITNGLGLLGQPSYVNFLVTGGVLLLAATVDAVSRRRRSSAAI